MEKNNIRWAGLAAVAAMILILIFQNTQGVVASVFFWRFELSLALLVFLVALVSFGIGYLLARWSGSRRSRSQS